MLYTEKSSISGIHKKYTKELALTYCYIRAKLSYFIRFCQNVLNHSQKGYREGYMDFLKYMVILFRITCYNNYKENLRFQEKKG